MTRKAERSRIIRSLFLSIPIVVGIIVALLIVVALFMVKEDWGWSDMLKLSPRSPWIFQAIINFLLLWVISISGAKLFSNKKPKGGGNYGLAFFALAVTALLHPMVYGIAWFVSTPYSLLGPYHRSMVIFGGFSRTSFGGISNLFSVVVQVIIHLFTPQVLLGLVVVCIACRRGVIESRHRKL